MTVTFPSSLSWLRMNDSAGMMHAGSSGKGGYVPRYMRSIRASGLSSDILRRFSPSFRLMVPTLLHIGPTYGACHMLLIGVAEAMNDASPTLTRQNSLSAAAFEKFRIGVRASIHTEISPSTSEMMSAPSSLNASSCETNLAEGPLLAFSTSPSVHTGASMFFERYQWYGCHEKNSSHLPPSSSLL